MKKSLFVEVTVIRFLVILIQLVFLKIYTRYVSVYEIGIFLFLQTISYSLNAFLFVPLDYFQQSRLYKLKNEGYSLKSFYQINKWVLTLTGAIMCLSIIICYFIKPSYCYIVPMVVILATSVYLVTCIRGFINNLERRRTAIYTVLAEYAVKVLLFLGFVRFVQPSGVVILTATVASSLIILLVLFLVFIRLPENKPKEIFQFHFKEVITFAYPLTVSSVINWIQIQGYRLVLVPLGMAEVVGIYGTVSGVGANSMLSFSTVYSQMFVPNIYKSNGQYIKTYIRNGLVSIVLILIGGYFFSGFIVGLMTKHELVAYSSLMLYGILAEGGSMIIGPLMVVLTIHNKTAALINVYIVGLTVFLLSFLIIYLLHFVKLYTIGIPIVFTQFVVIVHLYILVNKILKAAE